MKIYDFYSNVEGQSKRDGGFSLSLKTSIIDLMTLEPINLPHLRPYPAHFSKGESDQTGQRILRTDLTMERKVPQ